MSCDDEVVNLRRHSSVIVGTALVLQPMLLYMLANGAPAKGVPRDPRLWLQFCSHLAAVLHAPSILFNGSLFKDEGAQFCSLDRQLQHWLCCPAARAIRCGLGRASGLGLICMRQSAAENHPAIDWGNVLDQTPGTGAVGRDRRWRAGADA
jgi:hypothetical protein